MTSITPSLTGSPVAWRPGAAANEGWAAPGRAVAAVRAVLRLWPVYLAVEARDTYTQGHAVRVAELAAAVATADGQSSATVEQVRRAALVHDIGKVAVPDRILHKPGRLSAEEMAEIQRHPTVGADILQAAPFMADLAPIVRHHHERFDGTGYPDRLAGATIPLAARFIAVVDAYDAMTSTRAYRPALPAQIALAEVKQGSAAQFDPRAVTVLEDALAAGRARERRDVR